MGPQSLEVAEFEVQVELQLAWESACLFDARYSETTDWLFRQAGESAPEVSFSTWKPSQKRPLFDAEGREIFRKEIRLFQAIFYWKHYPLWLRENVDQWVMKFPDLNREYRKLESVYHLAHENVTQFLTDIAVTAGIEGAMALSDAGEICRRVVRNHEARNKQWGQEFFIGDWPHNYHDLMDSPPDIRTAILKGIAIIGRLEMLLIRWRQESGEPIAPKPEWDKETRTLRFDGKVIREVRSDAAWTPILDVFQEDSWPSKVDNPLPHDADVPAGLRSLNKGLDRLRFKKDGEAICWFDRRGSE